MTACSLHSRTTSSGRPVVAILGLRAPGAQGGVERHVEQLAPLLLKLGWDVHVVVRSGYLNNPVPPGIKVVEIWAPRRPWLEAMVHSFLATVVLLFRRPSLVHYHAVGPAFWIWLARLGGLPVVFTHHGEDYAREKWGWVARQVLRLGEWIGMAFANEVISVSQSLAVRLEGRYRRACTWIPNGVPASMVPDSFPFLESLGIPPFTYVLTAARLVPEKRQTDLIAAFRRVGSAADSLIIAGDLSPRTAYIDALRAEAGRGSNIHLVGFRRGLELAELYAGARLFVLPSSHEGLPIALLEALSFGIQPLVSDIEANLNVGLPDECYYPVGDVASLAAKMRLNLDSKAIRQEFASTLKPYDWREIARRTSAIYQKALRWECAALASAG